MKRLPILIRDTREYVNMLMDDLRSHSFVYQDEKDLQRSVNEILKTYDPCFTVKKEYELTKGDIIDFYIPQYKIGIEVKIKGSTLQVARQISRYFESPQIEAIILVTTKKFNIPEELSDKLFKTIWIPNL